MIKTSSAKKNHALISKISDVIEMLGTLIWKGLSFSVAHEAIARKNSICFSIEQGRITAARGTRFLSRLKIQALKQFDLGHAGYASPTEFSLALTPMLREPNQANFEITLSIPKTWTAVQSTEFPMGAGGHLADVITYELDRFTPFQPDEAYYDFKILGGENKGLHVMIAAVKARLLDSYLEIFKAQGVTVNRVTFTISCIATLLKYHFKSMSMIVIDVKKDHYEGAVIRDGSMQQVFSDHFPSDAPTDIVNTLAFEIKSLIGENEGKGKILQVVINSEGVDLSTLGLKIPIQIKKLPEISFNNIKKSGDPSGMPYSAIGGVLEALSSKFSQNGLNLLSKGRHPVSKIPMTLSIVLFFCIAVLGGYYLASPAQKKETMISEIDRQITLRKERVKKIEALNSGNELLEREIKTIHDFKYNRPSVLIIMKALTSALPKNAWLERIKIVGTTVTIEGYTNAAAQLLPHLESSDYFQKAEFASPIVKNARTNSDRFSIKMEIKDKKKSEVGNTTNEKKK